jgi:hypothetical protein
MAQVNERHVAPLTAGFVAVLVFAIVGLAIVNHKSNR